MKKVLLIAVIPMVLLGWAFAYFVLFSVLFRLPGEYFYILFLVSLIIPIKLLKKALSS